MDHLTSADYLVIGAFGVAFVGLAAWVITYAVSTRGDWMRTREGRHLMTFRASLLAFMAMGALNNIFPAYPGRDAVRVGVVGSFAVSVMYGLHVLLVAQREGRARRAAEAAEIHMRGLRPDVPSHDRDGVGT